MYFTFCALINNIEFSLAPLFMLAWPIVKTTQCMIIRKTLLRPSPASSVQKIGSFRLTVSENNGPTKTALIGLK